MWLCLFHEVKTFFPQINTVKKADQFYESLIIQLPRSRKPKNKINENVLVPSRKKGSGQ